MRLTMLTGAALALLSLSAAAQNCFVSARTCVEAGGTRLVNGVPVTRDCWAYREQTTCLEEVQADQNGCRTLQDDADSGGEGGCTLQETSCASSVTDADGNETCLTEKEVWHCKNEIALPAVNAAWAGKVQATQTTVNESACSAYKETCTLASESCNADKTQCTRTYACDEKASAGCSVLEKAGCVRQTDPACTDESCLMKTATYLCTDAALPEGIIVSGDAEKTGSTVIYDKQISQDQSACSAITGAPETTCTLLSTVCTDSTPARRQINGKWYRSSCWAYERKYSCRDSAGSSTCRNLEQLAGEGRCKEVAKSCTDEACSAREITYQCEGEQSEIDAGQALFIESESTEAGTVEVSTCRDLETDESCRISRDVCADTGADYEEGMSCEKREITYLCGNAEGSVTTSDGCSAYAGNADCRLTHEVCLGTNDDGSCQMTSRTYECGGGSHKVQTGESCGSSLCIAGVCEESEAETSTEFAQGVAVMEIARQAGVYGDVATDAIFSGSESGCSAKAAGFSCCSKNTQGGTDMSNSAFGVALVAGTQLAAEAVKYVGSPWVYDILSYSESTSGLLTALYGNAASGAYSPSFSFYGVSASVSSGGSLTLEFSPSTFALSIAAQMAAEYFSCTAEDQVHALRASRGLCTYVGSYCKKKSGGTCLEKRESWCCFNSKMALTVQLQGRRQLGMGWGSPEAPLCRGFTLDEFNRLDFGAMDLSVVIAEMAEKTAKVTAPASSAVQKRAGTLVDDIAGGADQYQQRTVFTGKCADGAATNCPQEVE